MDRVSTRAVWGDVDASTRYRVIRNLLSDLDRLARIPPFRLSSPTSIDKRQRRLERMASRVADDYAKLDELMIPF